ncbi:MAG TPA: helix-turn-helix domain-containing protein, partial [Polyangiaceae bacterium]|nr:helix-turn-helix domain-containing protein [Polyangiaceae bacterium]
RASQHTHSGSVAPHSIELPKFVRDVGSNHAFDAPGLAEQAVTGHEPWPSAPPSSGTALVGKSGAFTSLPELEEHVITDIFRECNGNLSMAARTLGIPRSTLRDRLKKYGMAPVSVPKKQMG